MLHRPRHSHLVIPGKTANLMRTARIRPFQKSGPAPFNPDAPPFLGDLNSWFDFTDETTMTFINVDEVEQIRAKIGSGVIDFIRTGQRPKFDNVNKRLDTTPNVVRSEDASASIGPWRSCFFAGRTITASVIANTIVSFGTSVSTSVLRFTNDVRVYSIDGLGPYILNGVVYEGGAFAPPEIIGSDMRLSAHQSGSAVLAGEFFNAISNNADRQFQGYAYHLLSYNRSFTDAQGLLIDDWLRQKIGMA